MLLQIMEVIRLYPDNTEIQIHGCSIVSKLQKEHKGKLRKLNND